jgi:hypothetical protein
MNFTPHSEKQERALFSDKSIVLCGTGIQWGKGAAMNQLCLTPNGYVQARNIKVGDYLIARDGKKTKVLGVYPQGVRPIYRITTKCGKSFDVDDNHNNIVIDPKGRKEHVLTTKELFEKKHWFREKGNCAQIPSCEPIKFQKRKLPIDPYLLGVLIGDGCIINNCMFSSADEFIIEKVKALIPPDMELKYVGKHDYRIKHKIKKTCSKGYGFNYLSNELLKLGLKGKGSQDKFIPDIYKYSSIEQRLDLLRGLMDTDGTAGHSPGKKMEYYTVSKELKDGIIYLVESLGGKAWYHIKKTTHKDCYRINIILKRFNLFSLPRKAKKYFVHKHTENKIIKSIEYIGEDETVCFSVASPTKSFIVQGQIVTHNTLVGAMRVFMDYCKYPKDNFIVAAPTFPILIQAALPNYKMIFDGHGKMNEGKMIMELYSGGKIFFRTGTHPDSVVGITNVRHIHGDEAGKYLLYFWENLQGRSALLNCPITLTTSPYSLNWLHKDIIKPTQQGKRDDVELVSASSIENPYFSKESYYKQKKTMDPRRFRSLYDGSFERMQGLVYDCFSEENNTIDSVSLPTETRYFAAVDWGYSDPFVLLIVAITPSNDLFIVSEHYKAEMEIEQIKFLCQSRYKQYPWLNCWADPSQPGMISMLNAAGIPVVKADNDIMSGVAKTYSMLKNGKLKFVKNKAPFTMDEIDQYHYPEPQDLKPDQDAKVVKPVDANNHGMDALRYVCAGVYQMVNTTTFKDELPKNTALLRPDQRISRLQKMSNNRQTESW